MSASAKPSLVSRAIRGVLTVGAVGAALLALALVGNQAGAVTPLAAPQHLPTPAVDAPRTGATQTAVLSGGCFWGVQGVFEHVDGVKSAVSGYAGGAAATAHYNMTSRGDTGHAESVRITFDPKRVSYGKLLQIFFSVAHDPTELNYQGAG